MNTMEALGTGLNLSSKSETPGLNLGADAEALALFASLFAMMQTPQKDGATAGPVPQTQPQSEETKQLLPAAAMLMTELAPTAYADEREVPLADILANDLETGEDKPGDNAGLLKLLLAAHDIAAPNHQAVMPDTAKDENMTTAAPARTATEMLTGAIEILKALEAGATPSGSFQNAPDHMETPPASAIVLQADPDFIGPMPAVQPQATLMEKAVLLPTAPDFIGPMPVVTPEDLRAAVEVRALAAPSSDFIGPMPVVTPEDLSAAAGVRVLAAPSSDFIGPMPVVTPEDLRAAVGVRVLAAPSSDFIGPMPALPSATVVQTVEASNSALNGAGTLAAVTHTATKVPAASQLVVSATETAEPAAEMPTIRSASAAANLKGTLQEGARPATGTTVYSPVPSSNAAPAPTHSLNPDLNFDQQQPTKSSASYVSTSDEGADKDEGFVSRRADMLTVSKDLVEKTASQQKSLEIHNKGARMMSGATELSQGSAASTSAPMQALAQQGSVTSQVGKTISSAGASDVVQHSAASTTSGQSGGQPGSQQSGGQPGSQQSGGQPGSQQSAQQMVDGGMARGTSDRTLLHRLNTDNAGWSEVMVKRLTADLRSGVQNVRIILEPRQLGRLNVELGVRNGQALIRIAAETQEAAKLLSGARGQLGQMLESAGLRLAGFQATSSHASDSGLDTSQGSQGRGGEGGSNNAGRNNAGRHQDFSNKMANALDDHADDTGDGGAALREGETAVLSILA